MIRVGIAGIGYIAEEYIKLRFPAEIMHIWRRLKILII